MAGLHTNVSGVWKKVNKVYVNVGGVWKPVKKVWVNVAGVWKVSTSSSNAFVFDRTISVSTNNFNLKNEAIASGWNQSDPLLATVTIDTNVVVSSALSTGIAFDTGSGFPDGSVIIIVNNGHIRGKGGKGGAGSTPISPALNGDNGGTALRIQYPTTVYNNGTIAGGGGGGGGGGGSSFINYFDSSQYFRGAGAGGGSGANGFDTGAAGTSTTNASNDGQISVSLLQPTNGDVGTATTGGLGGVRGRARRDPGGSGSATSANGGNGGVGGDLGQAGGAGLAGAVSGSNNVPSHTTYPAGVGGAAGIAVVGNSAITWAATGTRLGPIND